MLSRVEIYETISLESSKSYNLIDQNINVLLNTERTKDFLHYLKIRVVSYRLLDLYFAVNAWDKYPRRKGNEELFCYRVIPKTCDILTKNNSVNLSESVAYIGQYYCFSNSTTN